MKSIHLIRHAKSSWDNLATSDFYRDLNERGLRDAPMMAEKLKQSGCDPEYILCSPAKRTTKTAEIVAKKLNFSQNCINFEQRIYEATLKTILDVLNEIPNHFNQVVLIGHNPAITQLSNYLTNDYIDNIPTCGIVKIEMDIDDWQHIVEGIGRKLFFIYPKMF
ncbi:MAG: histidine phosphatase family protein [Flavobacteriales bacterium]